MDTPRGPLSPTGAGTATVARRDPSMALCDLVLHYWFPSWNIPDGTIHEQRILTYPGCNLVIENGTGTLYGPVTRLSTKQLSGSGRAFGVLLQPGTGALLSNIPLPELVDTSIPATACGLAEPDVIQRALDSEVSEAQRHLDAVSLFETWLDRRLPGGMDEEGLLLNRICADVESSPEIHRVSQIAERWQIGERSLQRLVRTRMGITPKWLLQRTRLQEAAALMSQSAGPDLAHLAYSLGYADQAHFTRDFTAVTGLSPGQYVRQIKGEVPES